MEKKSIKKKSSSKTIKKTTVKKKKGFTLLEFIIILIILGTLIAIAIFLGINYYDNESRRSYIDLAKDVINATKKKVNLGNYEMFDSDTTYYIESSCIKSKNLPQTTYGELKKAYVVVTYDGSFTYYWTSVSDTGHGIKRIVRDDKLEKNSIETKIKEEDITTNRGIDGRKKIIIIDKAGNCEKKIAATAEIQIDGKTGEVIK